MHNQPLFLPISDHSVVAVNLKLLGRFACNRPVKKAKGPPPIKRRRPKNDPHVRQEISIIIEDHFRAFPPSGSSSVDDVEITFTAAILQTAENWLRRRERPGCRGGDGGETPRQKQRSE